VKILSSYSIKGGVGKTALAVNLAFAFRAAVPTFFWTSTTGAASFYFRINSAEKFRMRDAKSLAEDCKKTSGV